MGLLQAVEEGHWDNHLTIESGAYPCLFTNGLSTPNPFLSPTLTSYCIVVRERCPTSIMLRFAVCPEQRTRKSAVTCSSDSDASTAVEGDTVLKERT